MFGVLNVNKPKGMTSHDVISRLRRIFKIKQIGHAGTLDPIARGVLPVCIGKATKLIDYLPKKKAYKAFARLGIETGSFDSEGTVVSTKVCSSTFSEMEQALLTFKGEIEQTPPIYSAVHYKGKRLYEYARENKQIDDIPTRKVNIYSIENIELLDEEKENPLLIFEVSCSEGTYIRSLISDLGKMLGCGAFMEDLIRIESSGLYYETSLTLEDIESNKDNLSSLLINPLEIIKDVLSVEISENDEKELSFGRSISNNKFNIEENKTVFFTKSGIIKAVGVCIENKLKPQKVFL